MLQEHGGVLGGETSGHILTLDKTTTGDAIIAALQVLAVMQQTGRSLAELAAGMHKFPQELLNVRVAQRFDPYTRPAVVEAVRRIEARLGGRGRVVLRASGHGAGDPRDDRGRGGIRGQGAAPPNLRLRSAPRPEPRPWATTPGRDLRAGGQCPFARDGHSRPVSAAVAPRPGRRYDRAPFSLRCANASTHRCRQLEDARIPC